MSLRVHVHQALSEGAEIDLDAPAVRHVQVRRLQPGDALVVFDGRGGEWPAQVLAMARNAVRVRLGAWRAGLADDACAVTLALGAPANDRMDWLVEKATELGAAVIQPLWCERSLLRVADERAARKQQHWQAVAQAAAEQCGRTRVLMVGSPQTLTAWLSDLNRQPAGAQRLVLSLARGARPLRDVVLPGAAAVLLSGPEGGLTMAEEAAAQAQGFTPASLGARTLRAETAPLAALAYLGLHHT